MNPYILIGTVILWTASLAVTYTYAHSTGKTKEALKHAEIKLAIEATREMARQGAADAIAKNKIKHTIIQGKVQTIIKDNPVYRDCEHTDDAFRLLNESITGKSTTGRNSSDSLPRNVSPLR